MADFSVPRAVTVDSLDAVVRGTGRYAGFQLRDRSGDAGTVLTRAFTSRDLDARFQPTTVGITGYHGASRRRRSHG